MDCICSLDCLYKYIDFEGGLSMLENTNIQFTRADALNDEYDCNWDLIKMPKIEVLNHYKFAVCSLGKTYDNTTLWSDKYAGSEGICIALDTKLLVSVLLYWKIAQPPFIVEYIHDLKNQPPITILSNSDEDVCKFFKYKDYNRWHTEEEIRFVSSAPFSEERMRYSILKECFKKVYIGSEVSFENKVRLENVIKQKGLSIEIMLPNI